MSHILRQTVFGLACVVTVSFWQTSCSDHPVDTASGSSDPKTDISPQPAQHSATERLDFKIDSKASDAELAASLRDWFTKDREACMEWVENESRSPRLTSRYARILLKSMPQEDFAMKTKWAERFPSDSSMMTEVAAAYAEAEPATACNWLASLDDQPSVLDAVNLAVRRWTQVDPESASHFILDMPEGQKRDTAITALSASISSTDMESARIWAKNITDTPTRNRIASALDALSSGL